MIALPRVLRLNGQNSTVALLLVAAAGAVVFTIVAGALVYSSTRRLITSAERVQHTEEVLASLQHASLLTERVEYRSRQYLLSHDEDQLDRARASASQLGTSVVHLRSLVSDNPYQLRNLDSLDYSRTELSKAVERLASQPAVPEQLIQRCQQTIGVMVDHEQGLLKDRTKSSDRTSIASIGSEFGFVILSLIILVIMFSLLLRDALTRQRTGKASALTNASLARSVSELEDRALESELLTSARDELQLCVDVKQVYHSAVVSFSRLLAGTSGSLCIINNSRQLVESVASWSGGVTETSVEDFFTPDSCCGLRSGQPRWRQPGVSEIHCTHFRNTPSDRYLCMPMVAHGNTLGVLYVQCSSEEDVTAVNLRTDGLRQLVQLTGMAVATLNLRSKLENQSIRDSLTGLFNRHFMQISLDRELARASRRKQNLAVFMLDLDHFKKFNDTYGHAAGDTVLKAAAEIFKASIRAEDIACRYGGEEFTIMLPDMNAEIAFERAENIRRAISAIRLPLDRDILAELSVSIGVAFYPSDGDTAEQLLRRADEALYRAKKLGRNRVVVFEEHLVEPAPRDAQMLHV